MLVQVAYLQPDDYEPDNTLVPGSLVELTSYDERYDVFVARTLDSIIVVLDPNQVIPIGA